MVPAKTYIWGVKRLLYNKAAVLLLAALVIFLRKPEALLNPQFWAEDGTVFFLDQYIQGWTALAKAYSGYLHLVPRIIAIVGSWFPYSLIPAIFNVTAFALTLYVVSRMMSDRITVRGKTLMALAMVMVPQNMNEVFLNIANIQWFLFLLMIIIIMQDEPDETSSRYRQLYFGDMVIMILCGLTGPFSVFLFPVTLVLYHFRRSRYSRMLLLTVFITASVQLILLFSQPRLNFAPSQSNPDALGGLDISLMTDILGHKLLGNLLLGPMIPYSIPSGILAACLIGYLAFALFQGVRLKEKGWYHLLFVYVFTVLILATLYKYIHEIRMFTHPFAGPRYTFIPYVMLVWSVIMMLQYGRGLRRLIFIVFLSMAGVSSVLSQTYYVPYKDFRWKDYAKLIGKVEKLEIPVNPAGWVIRLEK